jgi:hypothetical protein
MLLLRHLFRVLEGGIKMQDRITSYRRVQEPDTDIPCRKPLYGLLYRLKQGPKAPALQPS